MTIICMVASVFNNSKGGRFIVSGKDLGKEITNVPEWVKETDMFKWLQRNEAVVIIDKEDRKEIPIENETESNKTEPEEVIQTEPVVVEAEVIPSEETPRRSTRKKTST